jgi:carbonic anhydrase/acetyltransferase-like protein (isoleucine patch superfamily)
MIRRLVRRRDFAVHEERPAGRRGTVLLGLHPDCSVSVEGATLAVWVGSGAKVLNAVTIGEGCVIGGGCVVTPPSRVAVGVAARIIGENSEPKRRYATRDA